MCVLLFHANVGERVTRASCRLCQHENRDSFERLLLEGERAPPQLDKEMNWREGTSDRHFRNHMGEYHMGSNSDCAVCTFPDRAEFEEAYFNNEFTSAEIALAVDCSERTVYHHLKNHLKPIVQASAATAIAIASGEEVSALRDNVERLNGELTMMLDSPERSDPFYIRNLVTVHKEVRETIRDIDKMQQRAMGDVSQTVNAQTVNILKVELAKESPEVWRRIRSKLSQDDEVVIDG